MKSYLSQNFLRLLVFFGATYVLFKIVDYLIFYKEQDPEFRVSSLARIMGMSLLGALLVAIITTFLLFIWATIGNRKVLKNFLLQPGEKILRKSAAALQASSPTYSDGLLILTNQRLFYRSYNFRKRAVLSMPLQDIATLTTKGKLQKRLQIVTQGERTFTFIGGAPQPWIDAILQAKQAAVAAK